MVRTLSSPTDRDPWTGIALLCASFLLLVSFFISAVQGTGRDLLASALQVYAFAAFAPALFGLGQLLCPTSPRVATILAVLGTLGAAGGVAYGVDRLQFSMSGMQLDEMGPEAILALPVPGACFPLTLLGLSLALWRAGLVRGGRALILGLGSILFPIGNIPDIAPIRVAAALLIFVSLAPLGWALLKTRSSELSAPVALASKA